MIMLQTTEDKSWTRRCGTIISGQNLHKLAGLLWNCKSIISLTQILSLTKKKVKREQNKTQTYSNAMVFLI